MVHLVWLSVPASSFNRHRPSPRDFNPHLLPVCQWQHVSRLLSDVCGCREWPARWERFRAAGWKLQAEAECDLADDGASPGGFWSQRRFVGSSGKVVGLAVLSDAAPLVGHVSVDTEQREMLMEGMRPDARSSMCFFDVLDVVAIGSFGHESLIPPSDDPRLLPAVDGQRAARWEARGGHPVAPLTPTCVGALLDLPCATLGPRYVRRQYVSAQRVLLDWQARYCFGDAGVVSAPACLC